MGQAESRVISDIGAFGINLVENPGRTITNIVTNPSQAISSTRSSVLNEGQPTANTSTVQNVDMTGATRSAFTDFISIYDSPEARAARGEGGKKYEC